MEKPRPIQFSLSQLLLATCLIALCFCCLHVSLTSDIRQPPEPEWAITILATPPIAGGLLGLLAKKTKGMLAGIAVGSLVVVLILAIAPVL